MTTIKKYLPKDEETKLVQGYMTKDLIERLRKKLKKDNVKIREWLEASAKAYLEEK